MLLIGGCAIGPETPAARPMARAVAVRPAAISTASTSDVSPATLREEAPAASPVSVPAVPAALRGVAAPVWHLGDQWAFRWESSEGQGEYVWTVDRMEVVDGVEQYVIKSGPREIYFRTRDLATTLETLGGVAEVKHVPPRTSFSWPLTPGTIWEQSYTEEKGPDALPFDRSIGWKIEAKERVRVDAGTFDTLRIVARHGHYQSEDVMYEMWYAPEVKQWVRLKEHFPAGVRYRELTDFALR